MSIIENINREVNKLFNSKELIQESLNKIINNYNSEIAGNVEVKITSFSWNGMLNDFLLETCLL